MRHFIKKKYYLLLGKCLFDCKNVELIVENIFLYFQPRDIRDKQTRDIKITKNNVTLT